MCIRDRAYVERGSNVVEAVNAVNMFDGVDLDGSGAGRLAQVCVASKLGIKKPQSKEQFHQIGDVKFA
eukprot:7493034-Prorocentrum_lima.AAC.1